MGTRRAAREYALQILYQWDLRRDGVDATIATFWEVNSASDDARAFAERLVRGTVEHLDEIDLLISKYARNWRLDRMETLDRNLLRMATEELLFEKETPPSVVINEAIEIARRFSTGESSQFINGLLDSIHRGIGEK
jgi:N utilization substance protein B